MLLPDSFSSASQLICDTSTDRSVGITSSSPLCQNSALGPLRGPRSSQAQDPCSVPSSPEMLSMGPSLPWVSPLTKVLAMLSLLCLPWRPLRIGVQRQDLAPGRTCGMSRPVLIVPLQPHLVPHVGVLTGMGEGPSLLSSDRAPPRAGLSTTVRTALELVPYALCVSYSAKLF